MHPSSLYNMAAMRPCGSASCGTARLAAVHTSFTTPVAGCTDCVAAAECSSAMATDVLLVAEQATLSATCRKSASLRAISQEHVSNPALAAVAGCSTIARKSSNTGTSALIHYVVHLVSDATSSVCVYAKAMPRTWSCFQQRGAVQVATAGTRLGGRHETRLARLGWWNTMLLRHCWEHATAATCSGVHACARHGTAATALRAAPRLWMQTAR